MFNKTIKELLRFLSMISIVAVSFTLADVLLSWIWPQWGGTMTFRPANYLTQSLCIYFLFLLPVALIGLAFYYISRRLPGIKGKGEKAVYNAAGAVTFLIIPILLFEVSRYSTETLFSPAFIIAGVVGAIVYIFGVVYIAPFVLTYIANKTSRFFDRAVKIVSYTTLIVTVATLIYVIVLPGINRPQYDAGAPNVLVISIDTLRKDHLSVNGYDGAQTPNIDRFMEGATRFDNAVCSSSWTLPSFGSLLTGLEPAVCGVDYYHPIRGDVVTLTELAREKGYRTECYYTNWIMYPEYGLSRGFDLYMINPEPRLLQRLRDTRLYRIWNIVVSGIARKTELIPSDTEFNRAYTIKALERSSERPFFIWCHFFDPHSPYLPPDGYIPGSDSRRSEAALLLSNRFIEGEAPDIYSEKYQDELITLYDGEIAYVDEQVGLILRALEDAGLSEDTIVVLLNDHGEEFWEHGEWGHGFTVYPEQADMVLAIRNPYLDRQIEVSGSYVSHVDIAATLGEILGVEWPYEIQGESFYRSLSESTANDDTVFTECYSENAVKGIRKDGYLYYRDYATGDCGLFNLIDDPEALHDISDMENGLAAEMGEELDRVVDENEALKRRFSSGEELELSPDREAQLKDLGYLD